MFRLRRSRPATPGRLTTSDPMSLLSTIHVPRRPQAPPPRPASRSWPRRSASASSSACSMTGGHIGASLGVVELTHRAALRVRLARATRSSGTWATRPTPGSCSPAGTTPFPTLRQTDGISGFLKRSESEHDQFGAGHAGTAMSAALGMATARDLRGEHHKVVAVVGDGALTCGLSYEGMNNAGHSDRDIILIVNDNGMSISPNVGAISKTLGRIVADPRTNRLREKIKAHDLRARRRVRRGRGGLRQERRGERQEPLLARACCSRSSASATSARSTATTCTSCATPCAFVRGMSGPRVIHVMTEKGKGFAFAEANQEKWHGLAAYDPVTGEARKKASGPPTWTQVFGDGLTALAGEHPELVAITAAMPSRHRHQHLPEEVARAVLRRRASPRGTRSPSPAGSRRRASGRSCAIYSTFLQRAYDNIIHDIAVQHLPVIVLHGPRGTGGRGRPDPHGPVRHRLHAGGAGHDGDRAEGRRRARSACCARRWRTPMGPFCTRYPRDKAPAEPRPAAEIPAVPYGTWESAPRGQGRRDPRRRHDGAAGAAGGRAARGRRASTAAVVNCRFLKPLDSAMLEALLQRAPDAGHGRGGHRS